MKHGDGVRRRPREDAGIGHRDAERPFHRRGPRQLRLRARIRRHAVYRDAESGRRARRADGNRQLRLRIDGRQGNDDAADLLNDEWMRVGGQRSQRARERIGEWVDVHGVRRRRGLDPVDPMRLRESAAVLLIADPQPESVRAGLAKHLATIPHIDATKALARLAIFSPEESVRSAAIEGLNDFASRVVWTGRLFGPDSVGGQAELDRAEEQLRKAHWEQYLVGPAA